MPFQWNPDVHQVHTPLTLQATYKFGNEMRLVVLKFWFCRGDKQAVGLRREILQGGNVYEGRCRKNDRTNGESQQRL